MKVKKGFLAFVIVASILASVFSLYFYQMVYTPNVLVEKEGKVLLIPGNSTFKSVQDSLYKGDYVQDLVTFSFLAKMMDYDEQVKPGRYELKSNMSNVEAIRLLRSGRQSPVHLTFNNVRLTEELGGKLTKWLAIDSTSFNQLLQDEETIQTYGFNKHTIPAMFIPNTYEVYWTISSEELLERMHTEYKRFWNGERLAKAQALGMTPVEVSTLASIVKAETTKMDEAPRVAGVYINRLKRGMLLQADPTLVFAAKDFTIKRVLNEHKAIDSPFNTYKYKGLPPGPINVPSIAAIDAVLNYEKHNYLYFCAKEDFSGYHTFATNLREHLNNARRYQNALNKARLYR
jgi:UPF0755 protein